MSVFRDLALLEALVSIAESGSISGAARRLKTQQPTLSRQLQALEKRCGAVLLRRDTHRMTLTEAGRQMLGDARAILAFVEEAEQRVRNDQTELHGHLRLFATVDFGQFLFTRLIASFMQRHPNITAELFYSNRPVRMIEEGCDAGLIAGEVTDDAVVAWPAGQIHRCLAAAPSLIESRPAVEKPADLKTWPWLALSSEQFGGARTIRLSSPKRASQTLNLSPILLTVGVTSLRTAALAGLGVVWLPLWLIKEDLTAGRLAPVLPAWSLEPVPVHVIYAAHRILPARIRAFVDVAIAFDKTVLDAASL
jgi:DNA-binding transcriptional LysR family regulator